MKMQSTVCASILLRFIYVLKKGTKKIESSNRKVKSFDQASLNEMHGALSTKELATLTFAGGCFFFSTGV